VGISNFPPSAASKGTVERGEDKDRRGGLLELTYAHSNPAEERLAAISRAPNFHFCIRVDSAGMHTTAMDHVSEERVGRHSRIPGAHRTATNGCRGDTTGTARNTLRGPNVLVATGCLKLIDFDWRERKARLDIPLASSGIERNSRMRREALRMVHDVRSAFWVVHLRQTQTRNYIDLPACLRRYRT